MNYFTIAITLPTSLFYACVYKFIDFVWITLLLPLYFTHFVWITLLLPLYFTHFVWITLLLPLYFTHFEWIPSLLPLYFTHFVWITLLLPLYFTHFVWIPLLLPLYFTHFVWIPFLLPLLYYSHYFSITISLPTSLFHNCTCNKPFGYRIIVYIIYIYTFPMIKSSSLYVLHMVLRYASIPALNM